MVAAIPAPAMTSAQERPRPRGARPIDGDVPQCRQRGDPRSLDRRGGAGDQCDEHTDDGGQHEGEVSTTRAVPATANPADSLSALSPAARPTPAATPMADASTPTTIASTTVEPSTCRRDAPMARNSADSRVRWATRIENVL